MPPARWLRATLRTVLVVAGLSGLLAVAVALLLPGAAGVVATRALRGAGFPEATVTLDDLSVSGIVATIALGDGLGGGRVVAGWSAAGLLKGRIDRVILEGGRIVLEASDLDRFRTAPGPPADGPSSPLAIPVGTIVLRDMQLSLLTPRGLAAVSIAGEIQPDPVGGFDAEVQLDPVVGMGDAAVGGRLSLGWTPGTLPTGTATFQADAAERPDGAVWSATVAYTGRPDAAEIGAILRLAGGSVQATATLAGVPGPDLSVSLRLDAVIPDLARLLAGVAPAIETTGVAGGPVVASLDAEGRVADGLRDARLVGRAEGLSLGGWVEGATIDAAAGLSRTEDGWQIRLDAPLVLEGRPGPMLARTLPTDLKGPLRGTLSADAAGPATILLSSDGETSSLWISGRVGLEMGPAAGGGDLRIDLASDAAPSGAIRLESVAIDLPPWGLALRGLDLTGRYDPTASVPLSMQFAMRSVIAGVPLAILAPLRVQGSVTGDPSGILAFGLESEGADGRLAIDISGRHDVPQGTGGATLELFPLRLSEETVPLASISPLLADRIETPSGRIGARVSLGWTPVGSTGRGELLLEDIAGAAGPIAVTGLNGVLTADSLMPLSLPPGQVIGIAALDVGLPLTDGLIRFGLLPERTFALESARFDWAGGTVAARGGAVALDAAAGSTVLEARGLGLAQLLELAGVDGLAATGTLDGDIPLTLAGGTLRIIGGRLAATAPGTIRYDPEKPPGFLTADDSAGLALQAFRNFRYTSLEMGIDGDAGGELVVTMKVRGSNPDFYDGYPVALNLTLSGALDTILRRGLGAYRIPDAVRQRLEAYGRTQP